jgi:hypothetical protein
MKTKLLAIILVIIASAGIMLPVAKADTLVKEDFLQESFSKTALTQRLSRRKTR